MLNGNVESISFNKAYKRVEHVEFNNVERRGMQMLHPFGWNITAIAS